MSAVRSRKTLVSQATDATAADLVNGCCVVIPPEATTLAGFRTWSASDTFPERGKITFVDGEIIVDMSPERIDAHSSVKTPIYLVVGLIVAENLGRLFTDRTRFVHEPAGISNEPEALFISWATFREKHIRKVRTRDRMDSIEFEGTPDWVLEVVGPSSVVKDTVTWRKRYHRADIPEYWLIDARDERLDFTILVHHSDDYRPARKKGGWARSKVLGKQFRLVRSTDEVGEPAFRLDMK